MGQDTRRDPRAKVLSMTVRYKSATLDEFIEHHSHDVSRGGMFVKTPSPFPPGTLLKFEVKIAEERRVMQGVGRVVWKRESAVGGVPAGMGVKFIKIDDDSKNVIDRLIAQRGEDSPSAFERGEVDRQSSGRGSVRPSSKPGQIPKAPSKRPSPFKATVIGLGNMTHPEEDGVLEEAPADAGANEPFFPKDDSIEAPPEDERTVMRQATEFLADALASAGGTLEDVGGPAVEPARGQRNEGVPPPRISSELPQRKKSSPPLPPSAKRASAAPKMADAVPEPLDKDVSAPRPRRSDRPKSMDRPSVAQIGVHAKSENAGSKALVLLLGAAVLGGIGLWFLSGRAEKESGAGNATPPTPAQGIQQRADELESPTETATEEQGTEEPKQGKDAAPTTEAPDAGSTGPGDADAAARAASPERDPETAPAKPGVRADPESPPTAPPVPRKPRPQPRPTKPTIPTTPPPTATPPWTYPPAPPGSAPSGSATGTPATPPTASPSAPPSAPSSPSGAAPPTAPGAAGTGSRPTAPAPTPAPTGSPPAKPTPPPPTPPPKTDPAEDNPYG